MSVKDSITMKLTVAFSPTSLDVIDESHQHAGHIGHPASGHPGAMSASETHFRVKIVSAAFAGKSRIEQHRMINRVLEAELKGGVHALAIEARVAEGA